MGRILFMNGGGEGHVNPTISVVKELVQRGQEVVYYTTDHFRERLEAAGAEVRTYDFFQIYKEFIHNGPHMLAKINGLLSATLLLVPQVMEQIKEEHFDGVVHDSMFGGGGAIARLLGVSAVNSCTTFAFTEKFFEMVPMFLSVLSEADETTLSEFEQLCAEIERKFGHKITSPYEGFFNPEPLNVVYTSRVFQPQGESFDERFRFVGPAVSARLPQGEVHFPGLEDSSVIYISLGTAFNKDFNFYRLCFDAFGCSEHTVILSAGRNTPIESLGEIPGNFIVRPYVPQLEVLSMARLFITHGGMNSTNEGLLHNVPLLVVPQGADQPMVARRVAELGAGIFLDKDGLSADQLRDAAQRVLSDPSYLEAARRIGASLREKDAATEAAEAIINYFL